MKVTLREKPISGSRLSLYLDFYPPIRNEDTGKDTRREFLGLYLFEKPRIESDRKHNKETRQLADNIRANRQLAVQAGNHTFLKKAVQVTRVDFLNWFKQQAQHRFETNKTKARSNWLCLYHHLQIFTGGALWADAVDEPFCRGFKEYLATAKNLSIKRLEDQVLSNSTMVSYFTIFKTALSHAVQDGILSVNPGTGIKPFKPRATERAFLTLVELQAMANADCDIPELKRAGLFSALTGMRYGDIEKLSWKEVVDGSADSSVRFTQQKTKQVETLPLSVPARTLLGDRAQPADKVFPSLYYSNHQNHKLHQWAARAGITRAITFHAFRHTFATLQIQHGTDLYTVSKLLGHQDMRTTQIYAKIVDEQKRAAVNRLSIDL